MREIVSVVAALVLLVSTNGIVHAASAGPTTKPVYDPSADAAADVATAVRVAQLEHQRVLLEIGGNWCHWCTQLHGVFTTDRPVAALLASDYRVVYVDVGDGPDGNRNLPLLKTYGIEPHSFPYLAVLGGDNNLVVQQETGVLEDGPRHDPKKVLAFLGQYKAPTVDADAVLATALADAGKGGKRVFLHFSAGWCGWCHRLEDVLYQPAVTDAIQADFVMAKIDTDRMTHGGALLKRYQTSGGIPWYAVLTPDGKVASTSDLTPGNNIGFPTEPAEIDHVVKMFTDGQVRMTDAQVAQLRDAFEKAAAVVNASRHR